MRRMGPGLVLIALLLAAGAVAAQATPLESMAVTLEDMPSEQVPMPGTFDATAVIWVNCLEGINGYDIATAKILVQPGYEYVVVAAPASIEMAWPLCEVPPGLVRAAEVPIQLSGVARNLPPAHEDLELQVTVTMEPSTRRAEQIASTSAFWQAGLHTILAVGPADNAGGEVDTLVDVPLFIRSDSNGPVRVHLSDDTTSQTVDVPAMSRVDFSWPFKAESTKSRLFLHVAYEDPANPGIMFAERDMEIPVAIVGSGFLSTPGPGLPMALLAIVALAFASRGARQFKS